MKLESRYIVFKQSDAAKYLTSTAIREINDSLSLIFKGREADGKVGFPNYIVLEEDWPEYPIAKEALEGRIVLEEFNKRAEKKRGAKAAEDHYKQHQSTELLRGVSPFCAGWNDYMRRLVIEE
ncbi:hypothetical protein [Klebsiella phage Shaphc-TDM-1124-4]|uniref:Uncharacterized protein n=4 Tax=Viruses TaxID=10239 RepID=A0A7R8R6I4_9CAUD|nr:hypothetical protein [Klebsiella phage Shaphc-TDM-1124-4]CAD5239455.1 hypothetical protein NHPMDKGM_00017 [Klebsiella phage vB_KppS-Anoxic]